MKFFSRLTSRHWLIGIVGFGLVLRLAALWYGLPLQLIDDEPPFILGALKMLELKTFWLGGHLDDFRFILYYPPYISYLFLLPFAILIGIEFFVFLGPPSQFILSLALDNLSVFFILARFLSIAAGTASIIFLYQAARQWFVRDRAAVFSAWFLATSLLHISLSATARHWLPLTALFTVNLYLLTSSRPFRQRYTWCAVLAGFSLGISSLGVLILLFNWLWHWFTERPILRGAFKERWWWAVHALLIGLAILPSVLYPAGFGFLNDVSILKSKTALGLVTSPWRVLRPIAVSEPILLVLAGIGLAILGRRARRFFWPVVCFVFSYSAIFYLLFRFEHRFTLLLFPLLCLLAGYGLDALWSRLPRPGGAVLGVVALLLLTASALRWSYLLWHNDSRVLVRQWVEANLPREARLLIYGRGLRLSVTPQAAAELATIDPSALRRVDDAERSLPERVTFSFHALNLYSVVNEDFFNGLGQYAREHNYQYLIFTGTGPASHHPTQRRAVEALAASSTELYRIGDREERFSQSENELRSFPWNLFRVSEIGPAVAVYQLAE